MSILPPRLASLLCVLVAALGPWRSAQAQATAALINGWGPIAISADGRHVLYVEHVPLPSF